MTADSDNCSSAGEELDDKDVRILNSDYGDQRDLTFIDHSRAPLSQHYHHSQGQQHLRHAPTYAHRYYQGATLEHGSWPPQAPYAHQYPGAQRQPLVHLIKNEWRHGSQSCSSSSSHDFDETPTCSQIVCAPRFQRSLLAVFLGCLFLGISWKLWGEDRLGQGLSVNSSVKQRIADDAGWFGGNLRPNFFDMVHVSSLDESLVPTAAGNKRLIAIGDVHGCHDELTALLKETNYRPETDHLIFTGDLISKGPNSALVVETALKANASCVRGNHEDRLLLTYRDIVTHPFTAHKRANRKRPPPPGIPESAAMPDVDSPQIVLDIDDATDNSREVFARLDLADRLLTAQLKPPHMHYLSQCPVILDVGDVPGQGPLSVVHGGLVPGVANDRQDPVSVMSMRDIDLDTHVPSSEREQGTPWYRLWNKYQEKQTPENRKSVIYGHDSKRGLQLEKFSMGIDSGCYKGGKLTALVFDGSTPPLSSSSSSSSSSGGGAHSAPTVVSVDCKDYRPSEKEAIKAYQEILAQSKRQKSRSKRRPRGQSTLDS